MKFIHTGDIHWGMSPDSDKPWSRERARDIRDTFAAIIEKTRKTLQTRLEKLNQKEKKDQGPTAFLSQAICFTASRCKRI